MTTVSESVPEIETPLGLDPDVGRFLLGHGVLEEDARVVLLFLQENERVSRAATPDIYEGSSERNVLAWLEGRVIEKEVTNEYHLGLLREVAMGQVAALRAGGSEGLVDEETQAQLGALERVYEVLSGGEFAKSLDP